MQSASNLCNVYRVFLHSVERLCNPELFGNFFPKDSFALVYLEGSAEHTETVSGFRRAISHWVRDFISHCVKALQVQDIYPD